MVRKIREGVLWVGAIDWSRRLFDELIPLPEGTSYNAYVVRGNEHTVLIDTVDPSKEEELLSNLKEAGIEKIDFIISQHGEQDHSGCIPRVLELFPEARVLTNKKCKEILQDLLHIPDEKFRVVEDGEILSLGGKTLEFILAPWVHWPDTMFTYIKEDKILFTCDFLGSHLATSDLFAREEEVYAGAKRYYAEIMMPFRANIRKHLERLEKYEIELIAPSHGPVYKNPEFILNAYRRWASDEVEPEVVVAYVSMHGSTERMVSYLVDELIKRDVRVKLFNLTVTDIGEFAEALVDAAGIVFATPTLLAGPHPSVLYACALTAALRPKIRFVSIIGSYGWGGRTVDILKNLLSPLRVEYLPPVLIKGYPREENLTSLKALVDNIQEHINKVML
ncbi:FprA family A-type flavoprotein [bacterium]|nr:MAG: FprA family A-type flavoprotein [bacterium]